MKTITRAVIGACIALGALAGAASVASADPLAAIDQGPLEKYISLSGSGTSGTSCPNDPHVYVAVGSTAEAEVCL